MASFAGTINVDIQSIANVDGIFIGYICGFVAPEPINIIYDDYSRRGETIERYAGFPSNASFYILYV